MPDRVACIRLIEEFLLSRLYAFPEYNLKRVSTVLEAVNLHPHIRSAQLADVACLSNKQFGRGVCGVCRCYSQGVSAHCADTAGVVYSTMPAGHFVCATGLRMWFLRPIAHDLRSSNSFRDILRRNIWLFALLIPIISLWRNDVCFLLSGADALPYFCGVLGRRDFRHTVFILLI